VNDTSMILLKISLAIFMAGNSIMVWSPCLDGCGPTDRFVASDLDLYEDINRY